MNAFTMSYYDPNFLCLSLMYDGSKCSQSSQSQWITKVKCYETSFFLPYSFNLKSGQNASNIQNYPYSLMVYPSQ